MRVVDDGSSLAEMRDHSRKARQVVSVPEIDMPCGTDGVVFPTREAREHRQLTMRPALEAGRCGVRELRRRGLSSPE